jgi:serine/threonine protein kinase
VKVLDFGVSKFNALDSDMSMTKHGRRDGHAFLHVAGAGARRQGRHRSDLYSVGVVMYQAVTGRLPFNAETFNELVFKIALESPEPAELVVPGLDPSFAAIIVRSMVRDPAGRFQTAQEFQSAVAQWMMTAAPDGPGGTIPVQPGLRMSMPGFGTSTPNAQSGANFGSNPSLGTSGSLGASGSGLNQSQPGNLSQSGGQLGASQTGMAVTAPQPRSNGAMIAIGFAGVLVVAGGGFGLYQAFGKKAPDPVPTAVAATNTPVPSAKPSAVPTATEATPPPSAPAPATAAPVEPTATAVAVNDPAPRLTGTLPKGKTPPTPSATPSTKPSTGPTAPPAKTGRVIDGQL